MIRNPRLGTAAYFLVLVGTMGSLALGCERNSKTEEAVEEVQDEIDDAKDEVKDEIDDAD